MPIPSLRPNLCDLAASFLHANLVFMAARSIASEGNLYFGTGKGKLAMIDLRDILDCVEQSVISDENDNQIFLLSVLDESSTLMLMLWAAKHPSEESADGLDSLRGQVSHLEPGRHRP